MLYSDVLAHHDGFNTLLNNATPLLIEDMRQIGVIPTSSDFEEMVKNNLNKASQGTVFEGTISRTGSHSFPDIVAKRYFGVEVKMTKEDKWTSTGNSIVESLRENDVEKIHIMFGKFGGEKDAKHRLYQECLSSIAVTHSPRYMLDMELNREESIFDKMDIPYDEFRLNERKIHILRSYYRSQLKDGEELWWMDFEGKEKTTLPIIHQYKNLTPEEKTDFIIKCMILFPEIFGNSPTKFEKPCAFLMKEYSAVCPNICDLFTAGGKEEIIIGDYTIKVPKILSKLNSSLAHIYTELIKIESDVLSEYWGSFSGTKYENWKKLVLLEYGDGEYKDWLIDIL